MRVVKEAHVRKSEILDAAEELFTQKGFDATSISDIMAKVDVARGTIYYHFKSKEEIMDALIERYTVLLLTAAGAVADDHSIPVPERLIRALMAMNLNNHGGSKVIEHMNKPQNALMHQKIQSRLLKEIPPILTEIILDGIDEGLLNTPYPYESTELFVAYANAVFDNELFELTEIETLERIEALIFNFERLFGAEAGSFSQMIKIFGLPGDYPLGNTTKQI